MAHRLRSAHLVDHRPASHRRRTRCAPGPVPVRVVRHHVSVRDQRHRDRVASHPGEHRSCPRDIGTRGGWASRSDRRCPAVTATNPDRDSLACSHIPLPNGAERVRCRRGAPRRRSNVGSRRHVRVMRVDRCAGGVRGRSADRDMSGSSGAGSGREFASARRAVRRSWDRAEVANERLAEAVARLGAAQARARATRAYLEGLPSPRLRLHREHGKYR